MSELFKVELFESYGDERDVVNTARASFDNFSHELTERDIKLCEFLIKKAHITTLFHNYFCLRVERSFESFKQAINYFNEISYKYNVVSKPYECLYKDIRNVDSSFFTTVSLERMSLFAAMRLGMHRNSDFKKFFGEKFSNCFRAWEENEFECLESESLKSVNIFKNEENQIDFIHESLRITIPFYIKMQFFKSEKGFGRVDDETSSFSEIDAQITKMSQNEVSRRYVSHDVDFTIPDVWNKRPAKSIKQGSGEILDQSLNEEMTDKLKKFCYQANALYRYAVDEVGVAPEQARAFLPTASQTTFVQTGGLLDWARIYFLRSGKDAQDLIQKVAEEINVVLSQKHGESWEEAKRHVSKNYCKRG